MTLPSQQTSHEALSEAWRDGYDAAAKLVRIASQSVPDAVLGYALRGLVQTIDNSRDSMEQHASASTGECS